MAWAEQSSVYYIINIISTLFIHHPFFFKLQIKIEFVRLKKIDRTTYTYTIISPSASASQFLVVS